MLRKLWLFFFCNHKNATSKVYTPPGTMWSCFINTCPDCGYEWQTPRENWRDW